MELVPFAGPRELAGIAAKLPALFLPSPKASRRFWEFFTANIRNKKHAAGLLQGRVPLRRLVRGQGTGRARRRQAYPCRGVYRGAARRAFEAVRQATLGRAPHALRLAGGRCVSV